MRNSADLGPYSRAMPRALWWSSGGGLFLISEVPQGYAYGPMVVLRRWAVYHELLWVPLHRWSASDRRGINLQRCKCVRIERDSGQSQHLALTGVLFDMFARQRSPPNTVSQRMVWRSSLVQEK